MQELQSVKRNLGSDSSLFKQLIDSESAQKSVERKLDAIEPAISKLDTSVKSLETSEHNLSRGLEDFGEKLDKGQLVAANPALEMELSNKSVEISRLQSQLQEVSAELKSLGIRFTGKEAENEKLLQSLNDANSRKQGYEDRVINLESEKVALQEEIQVTEQRAREELTHANTVSQNNLKAIYKQQLQGLEKEKRALEKESAKLQKQVEKAEGALVGYFLGILNMCLHALCRSKSPRKPRRNEDSKTPWYVPPSIKDIKETHIDFISLEK
jgi:chromosome segregation ATPase